MITRATYCCLNTSQLCYFLNRKMMFCSLNTRETYYCLNASEIYYWLKWQCVTAWLVWRYVTAWLHVRCVTTSIQVRCFTVWIQGKCVTAWLKVRRVTAWLQCRNVTAWKQGDVLLPEPSCAVGFIQNAKFEILTALLFTFQVCLYLLLCHWVSTFWHSKWSWNILVQVKFFLDCLAEPLIESLGVTSEKFWIHKLSKSL